MAEVAAWAEAPARAIGRFDVRTPPKSLDEMWACAANEAEREAIRTAMFGSVMDVVDRYLPDRSKHAPVRSMLAFLAVNSTFRGPFSPGSALCLAFALASPGTATMSKVRGGLGTIADHLARLFEQHGGELRRHAKVSRIVVEGGAVTGRRARRGRGGHRAGRGVQPRSDDDLHPSARRRQPAARPSPGRVGAIDHRAAYFQAHFALRGLPEYRAPYEALNDTSLGRNVTFFGTAEQMQQDFEGCVRGQVPASPSFNLQIPSLDDPTLAPEGMHAGSSFAFYLPIGRPRDAGPAPRRDGRADRGQDRLGRPELPRPHRAPAQLPRLHLRADVRLCRRRLHPRAAPARVHGAVPARADGDGRTRPCPSRGCTSAGPGATVAPASRSSPATTAATPCWTERATGCSAAGAP